MGKRLTKKIKALVLGIIGIFLILIIIREVHTFRIKNLWNSVREECEQKGLSFDFSDIIPEPVPDDKNFAYVAPLKPLLEYEEDGVTPLNPEKYDEASNFLIIPAGLSSSLGPKGPEPYHGYDLSAVQKFFRDDGMELWSQPVEAGEPAADVMLAIGRVAEDMDLLAKASKQRPFYRLNVKYEVKNFDEVKDFENVIGGALSFPQHRNAQWWFNIRCSAHLDNGNTDSALADLKMSMFLAELYENEPNLLSQVCRLTLMRLALNPLWEGLAKKRWNAEQLDSLQNILANINYLEGLDKALRFERHLINQIHHYLRGLLNQDSDSFTASLASFGVPLALTGAVGFRLFPLKWFYISPSAFINGSQARSNELYIKYLNNTVDLKSRRIRPNTVKGFDQHFEKNALSDPYNFISGLFFGVEVPAVKKIGQMQNSIDQARIACALEIYHLKEGKYPQSLAELGKELPHDVFTGESYFYEPDSKGKYRIYGVGWNLKDDGGNVNAENSQSGEASYNEPMDVIWQNFPVSSSDEK